MISQKVFLPRIGASPALLSFRSISVQSEFSKNFVKCNGLNRAGFSGLVFCPGMLFNSMEKWWGDAGRRSRPHEGVDVLLYMDIHGQIHTLDTATKIPVMYSGETAAVHDDFLGKSMYVRHEIYDDRGWQLHTVYGHVTPVNGVQKGGIVKGGDVIAEIADGRRKNAQVLSHLHISMAWISETVPCELLNWETMGNSDMVMLLNPLEVMQLKKEQVQTSSKIKTSGRGVCRPHYSNK